MNRPEEIRAAPREWMAILRYAYPFLREQQSVGDLLLFGSQALSFYMKNPLRSKDLDFLSSQLGLRQMDTLAERLSTIENVQYKTTTVQTKTFDGRKMTTYAIELRINRKPFFVELFDSVLDGRPLSVLQPFVELNERWGLEVWLPNREATLALRLAFRPPEGISRLNALRLNGFIKENHRRLDFPQVRSILTEWGIVNWVERNLTELYQRNRIRIQDDRKIIPEIEQKLKHLGKSTEPKPK
ncbi:MAG: hypothetical protein ABSC50_09470 [Candidatus Bathyarchaeia archaeon]